jgi:hypothetical protein
MTKNVKYSPLILYDAVLNLFYASKYIRGGEKNKKNALQNIFWRKIKACRSPIILCEHQVSQYHFYGIF